MPWKSHLTECQILHYWSHTDFSSVLSVDWLIDMYYILPSIYSCIQLVPFVYETHGIAAANFPHPTLRNIAVHPTTRSRMKSRLSWSTVSLARTAPAHILGRQAGSLVRGLRSTKKVDSFTAGIQTRASRARESSVTHKSATTDHAVKCGREPCHRLGQRKSGR